MATLADLFTSMANAIRAKGGTSAQMYPVDMPAAIAAINPQPNLQTKSASYTPTESAQTQAITPDSNYDGLGQVNISVGAIDSEYVGSDVPRKSSSDLSASGATVTAPAGYYASSAQKSVASGSASTPATSITATPSISVSAAGLVTAAVSTSKSVTPSVTAGYVSSGTAGTVSVSGSNTSQLSTQAAKTVTPSTSQQTAVTAGKYTTGDVKVDPIPSEYIVPTGTKQITANGTGIDVAAFEKVDVAVPTGGGDSGMTLLGTLAFGALSTTTTQATNSNKSVVATGIYGYEALVVETSVNTLTNNRHAGTIGYIFLNASSNMNTKDGSTIATAKYNTKLSSSGVMSARSSTSAYGIYPNSCTISTASGGTATIPLYYRYNSTQTGTINGTYTTKVYGLKLKDILGG